MEEVILICTPLTFYVENDENAFFEWLNKISCIDKYQGIGRELHLHISSDNISDDELLELFGIFQRYNFDQSQLKRFKNKNNEDLFEDIK